MALIKSSPTLEGVKTLSKEQNMDIVTLYNQHDLFEKLKHTPVKIESSLKDVLMNYLRGKKLVKVVVEFKEISKNIWNLLIYDINNTGTTPYIVANQLLYVVGDDERVFDEAGKLGVHGMGLKQLIAKITTKDSISDNGGISVLTQRNGENDDKHFQITGVNPWITKTADSVKNIVQLNLNSVSESSIPFVEGLIPTENYLALSIPGVNMDAFDFESKDKTSLEVMADMVATYFVVALDEKVVSFHFRKEDIEGNVEEITVDEGAKFIDEYGNFISYNMIPKKSFVTSKAHKYMGRFLQSTSLTNELREEAKQKGIRIFGEIPELNKKHEDNWRGYVIDTTDSAGVVLGEFEEGRAAGHPFAVMFVEIPVNNVGTDSSKNSVTLAGSRKYKVSEGLGDYVIGLDGSKYRPITRTGDINKLFKDYARLNNPNAQFKETSRRDLGRKILKGYWPFVDDKFKQPAIAMGTIKEYISLYGLDVNTDISSFDFPKEVKFVQGRVILDQAVRSDDYTIANEWKKKETDIDKNQILAELLGWYKHYGSWPNEFMISCDSVSENIPYDSYSNFSEETTNLIDDLNETFENIKFTLVDTRYFGLNKKYSNFKSYK